MLIAKDYGAAAVFRPLIERAWRDEGTSIHYVAPSRWSRLEDKTLDRLEGAAAAEGISCVEMEAAALYAYAAATGVTVVCLAHVTNTMATAGDDFEKGPDNGVTDALAVVRAAAVALR